MSIFHMVKTAFYEVLLLLNEIFKEFIFSVKKERNQIGSSHTCQWLCISISVVNFFYDSKYRIYCLGYYHCSLNIENVETIRVQN